MTEPAHHDRLYRDALEQAVKVLSSLHSLEEQLRIAAGWCVEAFRSGHKLLACGNGGSASEAQHLVGEIVGRYKKNRPPLPAIALTSDSTLLTCIGNDYEFGEIFSRQVEGLGKAGDVLVVFTTSGNSPNILAAMDAGAQIADAVRSLFSVETAARRFAPLTVRYWFRIQIQHACRRGITS